MADELPIACERDTFASSQRTRQRELWSSLCESLLDKRELDEGFSLKLPGDKLMEASEVMMLERQCCHFVNLRLDAAAGDSAIWLTLEGPPGTKRVLETELELILGAPRP